MQEWRVKPGEIIGSRTEKPSIDSAFCRAEKVASHSVTKNHRPPHPCETHRDTATGNHWGPTLSGASPHSTAFDRKTRR